MTSDEVLYGVIRSLLSVGIVRCSFIRSKRRVTCKKGGNRVIDRHYGIHHHLGQNEVYSVPSPLREELLTAEKQFQWRLKEFQSLLAVGLDLIHGTESLAKAALKDMERAKNVVHAVQVAKTSHEGRQFPLEAMVEERVEERLVKRMEACFEMQADSEALHTRFWRAAQNSHAAWVEGRWRELVHDGVQELAALQPQMKSKRLLLEPRTAGAKQKKVSTEEARYHYLQTMFGDMWNETNKGQVAALAARREQQRAVEASALAEQAYLKQQLIERKASLWDSCHMTLPRIEWESHHDKVLANESQIGGEDLQRSDCSMWEDEESLQVLEAPPALWKREPERMQRDHVNVSFVLLYYGHPEEAPLIVDRLYACTEGMLGRGQLPGVTSEMIVLVDEPGKSVIWHEAMNRTAAGNFLFPLLQNNLHENRGYNRAARMARGEIFIIMQDDDIPPKNCQWVRNVLEIFSTYPRLAEAGMKGGKFLFRAATGEEALKHRLATDGATMRMQDPLTHVRMHFASIVDFAPTAFRRTTYLHLGGLDESMGRRGETGIFSDYHISLRFWLAGYQVAHVYLSPESCFQESGKGGTHSLASISSYFRRLNYFLNAWGLMVGPLEFEERIFAEVRRANHLLLNLDPLED